MPHMRLLVLGGTRFAGRAVVDEAVRRGYDVTTFTRGLSGEPRLGAEALHGDRTNADDLAELARREWDAVIDTSVLAPAHVAASVAVLVDRVGHYTYLSSIRAYRDWPRTGVDEDSPTHECAPDATGELEYGVLKAGSERAVIQAFSGRCLIVRSGVIVGPHESPPRLPWWLSRMATGGRVIAPGHPDDPVRLVDVRDLAAWIIDNTRRQIPGAVDIPGSDRTTFGDLLTACANVTSTRRGGSDPQLVWTAHKTLLDAGVQPWWELPMWVPATPAWAGTWQVSGERARMTGIHYRPLTDTVRDTWAWMRQEEPVSAAAAGDAIPGVSEVGIDAAKERKILDTH
jgi:nucleoside-diphosphate-sugar epimerase